MAHPAKTRRVWRRRNTLLKKKSQTNLQLRSQVRTQQRLPTTQQHNLRAYAAQVASFDKEMFEALRVTGERPPGYSTPAMVDHVFSIPNSVTSGFLKLPPHSMDDSDCTSSSTMVRSTTTMCTEHVHSNERSCYQIFVVLKVEDGKLTITIEGKPYFPCMWDKILIPKVRAFAVTFTITVTKLSSSRTPLTRCKMIRRQLAPTFLLNCFVYSSTQLLVNYKLSFPATRLLTDEMSSHGRMVDTSIFKVGIRSECV